VAANTLSLALALATGGVWVDPNGRAYAHDEGQYCPDCAMASRARFDNER